MSYKSQFNSLCVCVCVVAYERRTITDWQTINHSCEVHTELLFPFSWVHKTTSPSSSSSSFFFFFFFFFFFLVGSTPNAGLGLNSQSWDQDLSGNRESDTSPLNRPSHPGAIASSLFLMELLAVILSGRSQSITILFEKLTLRWLRETNCIVYHLPQNDKHLSHMALAPLESVS